MKDALKALLLLLGVTKDHAEKLTAGIPADTVAPEGLTNEEVRDAAMAKIKVSLKGDKPFMDEIHKGINGKFFDKVEAKIRKAFAIGDDEYEALEEKGRTDALLAIAAKKIADKTDGGDKSAEEITRLQGQLKTLKGEVKTLKEVELPAALGKGDAAAKRVRLERQLERELTKGSDTDEGLLVDAEFAVPVILDKILAQYDPEEVANGVKLLKKGEKVEDFDAEHNPVQFLPLARKLASDAKLLKLNNGGGGGNDKDGDKGGNRSRRTERDDDRREGVNLPPGLERAQQAAKDAKAKAAAAKA